ncbi:hypothetical protein [Natronobacterium gregoryi]|uniref:hypothetical protein n=1 Tax=Natronobacterium gregoryi TaxID=44930 RepID=UPI001113947F|nr:hypothetical protein [Natronobacterium gregoryi]
MSFSRGRAIVSLSPVRRGRRVVGVGENSSDTRVTNDGTARSKEDSYQSTSMFNTTGVLAPLCGVARPLATNEFPIDVARNDDLTEAAEARRAATEAIVLEKLVIEP